MDLEAAAKQINKLNEEYLLNQALKRKYKMVANLHLLKATNDGYQLEDILTGKDCPPIDKARKYINSAKRYLRENSIALSDALESLSKEIKRLGGEVYE
jgi:hypothetical protein